MEVAAKELDFVKAAQYRWAKEIAGISKLANEKMSKVWWFGDLGILV